MTKRELFIFRVLDLEPICIKTMGAEEGYGWSKEYALKIAGEYRRYLALCLQGGESKPAVPCKAVDKLWHMHILDTQKYADDCEKMFGYFLHHFPYFGMRGDDDMKNLEDSFAKTLSDYREAFGDEPSDVWLSATRCPKCGKRSKHTYGIGGVSGVRPSFESLGI